MYAIYGNIYHQYTPVMLACTPCMDPMGNITLYFVLENHPVPGGYLQKCQPERRGRASSEYAIASWGAMLIELPTHMGFSRNGDTPKMVGLSRKIR